MSLKRYSNITTEPGKARGVTWNSSDTVLLQLDSKSITPSERPIVELHLYTPGTVNNHITGGPIESFDIIQDKVLIDYAAAIREFGIERGQFRAVINVYRTLYGSYENPGIWVSEIAANRRELKLTKLPTATDDLQIYLDKIDRNRNIEYVYDVTLDSDGNEIPLLDDSGNPVIIGTVEKPLSADIALNLGDNNLIKIINQKPWESADEFVVRLYSELPSEFTLKQAGFIVEELSDSYIDDILVNVSQSQENTNKLRGPNFDINVNTNTITETNFETWNTLLNSTLSVSQQVIDSIFSGSLQGAKINIDYSAFDNFIHYSSAAERFINFKNKLELIEYYSARESTLTNTSGSDSSSLQNNLTVTRQRKDNVIGSFDGFEEWLYNEPTSSLFTHGVSGSVLGAQGYVVTPYPKYLSGSKYYLHPTTSSIAVSWYNGLLASASLYDALNDNALVKTIPEHIRDNSQNSQYSLFVNMIGHHYDLIFTYINNVSKIYHPEEHPKLSRDRYVLNEVAKSLGWQLVEGKQGTALAQYSLGVNSGSGAYQQTGSLFSKADSEITREIWNRTVNNLPFILKSKGTAKAIYALMNIHGIPKTLLSIREYGGPKINEEEPNLIEDRFSYVANLTKNSYIKFTNTYISSSIGTWGISRGTIPIITRELRIKPATTESMYILTGAEVSAGDPQDSTWHIAIEHTASYSGSSNWGRLMYVHGKSTVAGEPIIVSSSYVPIYDGDIWNIRYWYETTGTHFNTGSNTDTTYKVQIQKASDYITGKIVHSASLSLTPLNGDHALMYAGAINNVFIGGATSSADSYLVDTDLNSVTGTTFTRFSGSVQEYREWLETLNQTTFNIHTLNPASYVSALNPTSSYDTLVRHYPLGTDLNAIDLSGNRIISSSHPNQNILDFSQNGFNTYATASTFPTPVNSERGNFSPITETYYIQGVSLGATLPKSQKIRLEDNELIHVLSPVNTAERSRYDRAPLDTNKLGLFYSQADQVNKDIFNHIGDVALDDYIGDPENEFEISYNNLSDFSKEYWKKYSNRNDINTYIRIFSQFDFSLFNQIKQTIPERVNEAIGLLIEPNALERTKVRLTKRPTYTNPQYNVTLNKQLPTASAEWQSYTASIQVVDNLMSAVSIYHTGSNGWADTGNFIMRVSGSQDPYAGTIYRHTYTIFPYTIDSASAANLGLPLEITSSLSPLTVSPTGSFIDLYRNSNIYNQVIYYYGTGSGVTKFERDAYRAASQSLGLSYSSSLITAAYMDDFFIQTNNLFYDGCRLEGPGINRDSNVSAINNKPVIEVYSVNPNQFIYNNPPQQGNLGNIVVQ